MLKRLDFLESLPVNKVQEFVSIVTEQRFDKGTHILRKGDPGHHFYIIRSGNVSIVNEELVERKILGAFEYFGEVALLSEVPRTADVVAETEVRVYTVQKDQFLSFIYGTRFEKTLRRLVANRSSETWNLMASSPYLQKLTTYQKTWLESILAPRDLKGPGVLVKEGASPEQFFIIRCGEAAVSRGERLPGQPARWGLHRLAFPHRPPGEVAVHDHLPGQALPVRGEPGGRARLHRGQPGHGHEAGPPVRAEGIGPLQRRGTAGIGRVPGYRPCRR